MADQRETSIVANQKPETRLAANITAPILVNIWAILVSLLVVPLLLAGLGAKMFGLWALLQSFSGITGWISILDFGLMVAGTRSISQKYGENDANSVDRLTRTTLTLFSSISLLVVTVTLSLSVILPAAVNFSTINEIGSLRTIVLLIGIQGSIDLFSRGVTASMDGLQRLDLSRISDGLRRTSFLLASAITAFQTGSLHDTLLAGLISSCFTTLIQLCLLIRLQGLKVIRPSTAASKELLKEMRLIGFLRPLGVLNRTMDKFILGSISGLNSVGTLEVANSLQSGANALVSGSTDAVTPTTSFLFGAQQFEEVQRVSFRITRISILFCGPPITLLIVAPEPLLNLWLGDQVPADAALFTQLSCTALLISLLTVSLSNTVVGSGNGKSIVFITAISTVANLALSIALAIMYGPAGVLVGTTVGAAIKTPLILKKAKRLLSFSYADLVWSCWLKGLAPSIVAAGVLLITAPTSSAELPNILTLAALFLLTGTTAIVVSLTHDERLKILRR